LMLVIGYNYAWLMRRRPFKGGSYSYTKEAFGRDHAFLCAWFLCLSYLTIVFLNATALFIVSRVLFDDVPQISTSVTFAGIEIYPWEAALSVSVLIIVGIALILKKSAMQTVQRVLAIILMAGAVILTAACIPVFDWGRLLTEHGITAAQGAGANAAGGGLHSIGAAMTLLLLAPWAFAGFEIASLETPHFDFPIRKSWRVIAVAIICGGFVYTAMTCVSASVRPAGFGSWQEYVSGLDQLSGIEGVPVFYAAISRMGRAGLIVVTITALAAILTGVIGAYRGTMRMLSTMADDKILSAEFRGTTFCIIFIMGVSSIFTFLGRNTLNWFVELTSLGATIGFAYTSAAAFRIASREGSRTTQITGLIGAVFSGIFAVVQLASRIGSVETMCAPSFLLLALWCLLGFLFYWRTMRQSDLSDFEGATLLSGILFTLLIYSILMWFAKKMQESIDSGKAGNLPQHFRNNLVIVFIFVFLGLAVMMFTQRWLRQRHAVLEREKMQAEESSKAKSQFLFNMSHDIRTPMNAIIGYTHLAGLEEDVPPKVREYIEKIDISGKHLLTLINDVLEMSRIESGQMELMNEPGDLCEALETAWEMFREQMSGKGLGYDLDMQGVQDKYVIFDRNRFLRIILNLLSNAYKFTPEGGRVSVTMTQIGGSRYETGDGQEQLFAHGEELEGEEEWGAYEIRVKDTGIGMTKEFAEIVFEAFARERTSTVSRIQGTGLGMAITKSIVDAMQGTIDLVTETGKGSEFIIRLPYPLC
ncbi:MAG: amino acid permease, partial [Eubacteriales bacterium]|nr:amino acid permease [Eubacteriales bacterium]